MRIVKLNNDTKKDLLNNLLKRSPNNYGDYAATVQAIVDDVRDNGNKALFSYTKKFDKRLITHIHRLILHSLMLSERQKRISGYITRSRSSTAGLIQMKAEYC